MSLAEHGYQVTWAPAEQVRRLRGDINSLVEVQLRQNGVRQAPADLDLAFNQLCAIDRRLGGYIFDVVRELPSFLDLMMAPELRDMTREMTGIEEVMLPWGLSQFRIDRPGEERYGFPWHQDYPYNMMGRSAVTWWLPLTDVRYDMGPLRILPRSHHSIHPVRAQPSYQAGGGGNNRLFELYDPDLERFEAESVEVPLQAGAAIALHSLVLHRSGMNLSDRARWVALVRMGDLLDQDLVARGWNIARPNKPASMLAFRSIHPELCHELE